ncbi:MAG: hypothetical protein ACTSVY_06185 [Candidatus Helarchaeota archaeon]
MAERKEKLQKWQRKSQYEKMKEEQRIYPHYHCTVCERMIDKDEVYERFIVNKKDSYPHVQNYCSQECYDKVFGKRNKEKLTLKQKLKKHSLWLIMGIWVAIIGIVILVLWILTL